MRFVELRRRPYIRGAMASPILLIALFVIVCATALAMLVTSGAHAIIFDRFAVTSHIADNSEALAGVDSGWIDNHEFWDITATEEVAF